VHGALDEGGVGREAGAVQVERGGGQREGGDHGAEAHVPRKIMRPATAASTRGAGTTTARERGAVLANAALRTHRRVTA
jgi:hypothetical protein